MNDLYVRVRLSVDKHSGGFVMNPRHHVYALLPNVVYQMHSIVPFNISFQSPFRFDSYRINHSLLFPYSLYNMYRMQNINRTHISGDAHFVNEQSDLPCIFVNCSHIWTMNISKSNVKSTEKLNLSSQITYLYSLH